MDECGPECIDPLFDPIPIDDVASDSLLMGCPPNGRHKGRNSVCRNEVLYVPSAVQLDYSAPVDLGIDIGIFTWS